MFAYRPVLAERTGNVECQSGIVKHLQDGGLPNGGGRLTEMEKTNGEYSASRW